jgi:hypothetical protein
LKLACLGLNPVGFGLFSCLRAVDHASERGSRIMAFFEIELSPELKAAIAAERSEVMRMWCLPDRFLAEDLLRKVRWVREAYPTYFHREPGAMGTYTTSFVWELVPEIAYRLGARSFSPQERTRSDVRAADGIRLRHWLGHSLNGMPEIAETWDYSEAGANPWHVLTRECQNGNPVVFALDRIAPPLDDSDDLSARLLREVSWHRGFEPISAWSPELQNYDHGIALSSAVEEDEALEDASHRM